MKIREIYDFLNTLAPYDTQCQWDNSGLMAGSLDKEADSVMLCLDCTNDVIEQAVAKGCKLVVSHHPLIFKAVKCVEADTPLYNAIKNDITVLSCHTNLDMAIDGVNDMLCKSLDIKNVQHLYAEGVPIMRMGDVDEMSASDFAKAVSEKLRNSVKLADCGKSVKKVAVCGGAGGEYIREALSAGCDTFVTGEAKHHEYLDAKRININLLVAGHFATEKIVLDALYDKLLKAFPMHNVYVASEECPYETVV